MNLRTSLFLLFLSSATFAASYYSPDSIPSPVLPDKAKNEAIAYGLAIGSTYLPGLIGVAISKNSDARPIQTIGIALALSGVVVGPSTGQIYASSYKEGLLGIAARGLGLSLMVANGSHFISSGGHHKFNGSDALGLSGSFLFFGGFFYSLIDTHFAGHRYNNPGERNLQKFGVTPSWNIDENGTPQPGMMAWARF